MKFGFSFADQIFGRGKLRPPQKDRQVQIRGLLAAAFPGSDPESFSVPERLPGFSLRLNFFVLLMLLTFLSLEWRLFDLQIIHGRQYRVQSDNNRVALQRIPAPRGVIYGAGGEILARNQPGRDEKSIIRDYPEGDLLAHILGYTGEISEDELLDPRFNRYYAGDILGRAGLELTYEDLLRGQPGQLLMEVDSSGKVLRTLSRKDPRPGNNLYLSLDVPLQKKAGEILQVAQKKYQATAAVFVAQRIRDGRILALVSLPTYDNRLFAQSKEKQIRSLLSGGSSLFNRGISGTYPPGSTVKPVVAVAALQEGIITKSTRISDEPQIIRVGGFEFPDWTVAWGRGAHGRLDVKAAIAESCDIFFYKIGGGYPAGCGARQNRCEISGLGPEKLKIYFQMFGLGEKTGIDLPGEVKGLVPDPIWKEKKRGEAWFLGNTYHLSIGQGDLLVTPLQVNNLVTTIANGGKLVQPLLVQMTGPPAEDFVTGRLMAEEVKPKVLRESLVDPENLSLIREGMRQAVTEGIIYPLRGAKVAVAAKTGTAEFGTKNAKGEYQTHAWVTGFAPFDEPEISFTLLLESGGASSNAAKVAREILDWYFGK